MNSTFQTLDLVYTWCYKCRDVLHTRLVKFPHRRVVCLQVAAS